MLRSKHSVQSYVFRLKHLRATPSCSLLDEALTYAKLVQPLEHRLPACIIIPVVGIGENRVDVPNWRALYVNDSSNYHERRNTNIGEGVLIATSILAFQVLFQSILHVVRNLHKVERESTREIIPSLTFPNLSRSMLYINDGANIPVFTLCETVEHFSRPL